MTFPHPETGELLETRADFDRALAEVHFQMTPLYKIRRDLQDEYAKRFEPAELPERVYRTERQEKVARCPRCGGRLEKEE